MATPSGPGAAPPAAVGGSPAPPAAASDAAPSSASAAASAVSHSAVEAAQSTSTPVTSTRAPVAKEDEAAAATDEDEAAEPVAVPRCSTWFSLEAISPIERRMLPEFFAQPAASASKTAQLYLRYRNYMVQAYRQQPSVYLTATACRRNLAGDACAILRVHEFLSHWGLINFHVPPHAMPAASHPNYSLRLQATPLSGARAANEPVAMLVDAKQASQRRSGAALGCESCGKSRSDASEGFFELSRDAKNRLTSAAAAGAAHASATPVNSAANGKQAASDGLDTLTVAGVALRPGSGLCEGCYLRGAFPPTCDATDFVRARQPTPASHWTQQETTKLLEAVSVAGASGAKHEDGDDGDCDWNFVAAKVGGAKTADDCLLRFLELPLLGQPQRRDQPATATRVAGAVQSLHPYAPAEALNEPVLDLSALLQQADPLVAQAAAQAAIGAVRRLHTMRVAGREAPATAASDSKTPGDVKDEAIGASHAAPDSTTSFEDAAEAVKASAKAAGVDSSVKVEPRASEKAGPGDGDVAMEDVSGASRREELTTEAVAVAEEAASATTAALVAVRAHRLAAATAQGPVRDLVRELQENQVRQMELKMQQLDVLQLAVAAEREQLAQDTYALYVARLAFAQDKLSGPSR